MAWAGEELWFVNTRFSCLCTLNGIHSFVPRWRPPFVTALAPEDRCHLNGLGLARTANSAFVTALAATDTPQGWRQHKKDGGVLVDVPSSEVILLRGLSMPHSPRWHDGQTMAAGVGDRRGSAYVDTAAGRYDAIAELPGFTRGLDFHGDLAFVGLSQVRESAVFSGIPIAERRWRSATAASGSWTCAAAGRWPFLRFEDAVQEVFAVQVLPGMRYPEIAPEDPKLLADSYDLP